MSEKWEVIEKSTGAKMAHTPPGQLMSTTLFDSVSDAGDWMMDKKLTEATHLIEPANIKE